MCQYGKVCEENNKNAYLHPLIKNVFNEDIKNSNPVNFIEKIYIQLNEQSNILKENNNVLFYNEKIFINMVYPYKKSCDNINILGKKYEAFQVSTLLNYDKNILNALNMINSNYDFMIKTINGFKTLQQENKDIEKEFEDIEKIKNITYEEKIIISNYSKIQQSWNEIRKANTYFIRKLKKPIVYEESKKSDVFKRVNIFINGLILLNYDISNFSFDLSKLKEVHEYIIYKVSQYVNKIYNYLTFFNNKRGEEFLDAFHDEELKNKNVLKHLQNLCCHPNYSTFFHTEKMLYYYLVKKEENKNKIVYFVSYYDMCGSCEPYLAGKASTNLKFIVVSCKEYSKRRDINRTINPNENLIIIFEDITLKKPRLIQ